MAIKTYNFSAGPAMIPDSVRKIITEEFKHYAKKKIKAPITEISHRSDDFLQLAHDAKQNLRELINIPNNYKILFLQGGASAQFSMVPMNLLRKNKLDGKAYANYAITGHWSLKAFKEGVRYCVAHICTDSRDNNFRTVEDVNDWRIDKRSSYVHITPNETVAGLAFEEVPICDMPVVADMSSMILSMPIEVGDYGVIYAGAQKNIGVAGLTVVIVREDLIGKTLAHTPSLFDYKLQADYESMYNTPATFSWYVAARIFTWIKDQGGISEIARINHLKAKMLYQAIDSSEFYYNKVALKYRSKMNVIFSLADERLSARFLSESFEAGLLFLKGHRLVGGMRASIYNAMPIEGVSSLIDFMADFAQRYG